MRGKREESEFGDENTKCTHRMFPLLLRLRLLLRRRSNLPCPCSSQYSSSSPISSRYLNFTSSLLSRSVSSRILLSHPSSSASTICSPHPIAMAKEEAHTVRVSNVSPKATEHDIQDFFSFSGEIEHIELHKDGELSQTAFVTFKEAQALETALLLSGATVVDQAVTIAPADESERLARSVDAGSLQDPSTVEPTDATSTKPATKSAQEVFQNMLSKGYVLGNNTMSKAKSFDEKHQLTANASQLAANAQAKVVSIDNKIGITQKLSAGTAAINQQVKAVDEKYHVSEKTRTAVQVAEQKLNAAGTAIARNRYVLTGTTWVVGAYAKVAKTAEEVGQKTLERVATLSSGDQKSSAGASSPSAPSPRAADDVDLSSKVSPPTDVASSDLSQPEPASKPAVST